MRRRPHVLQSAAVLVVLMLLLAAGLAACAGVPAAPTPFEAGRAVSTPAGCAEARSRGHEC